MSDAMCDGRTRRTPTSRSSVGWYVCSWVGSGVGKAERLMSMPVMLAANDDDDDDDDDDDGVAPFCVAVLGFAMPLNLPS